MKKGKYFIVLFCNKKRVKVLYRCMKRTTVYEYWREFKTQRVPPFLKVQGSKRKQELVYEIALIFPNNRWATATYVKDSLGRNTKAKIEDDKFRIKEILPYWQEELIYDFQTKTFLIHNFPINIYLISLGFELKRFLSYYFSISQKTS